MNTWKIALLALILLASTVAFASSESVRYRACCTDDPDRHGCGISGWHDTENAANEAGARHAHVTSGHRWIVESATR